MKAPKLIYFCLLVAACLSMRLSAQQENLVPNPSFEEFSGVPLGWFYNGSQFTRLVKYWYSPSLASPDAFGPEIIVPSHWKKKGFGLQKAFDGSSMVGITVYGCADGKPHCREYIQVQLNESLVIGQKYEISYWLAHLDKSLFIDKIGALFSTDVVKQDDDHLIDLEPQIISKNVLKPIGQQWHKIQAEFTADSAYNYITIGNFYDDEENKVKRENAQYEFAYYYIDMIAFHKVPPYIAQAVPDDDLSRQSLEVGKLIQLKNIYFDLDKSDLLPRSFVELNKLKHILDSNPGMHIEIHGHTDIQGESGYNKELSLERSKSVTDYLLSQGIQPTRIDYKGYGSEMPIADNADESGRKLNRRVEILITRM